MKLDGFGQTATTKQDEHDMEDLNSTKSKDGAKAAAKALVAPHWALSIFAGLVACAAFYAARFIWTYKR